MLTASGDLNEPPAFSAAFPDGNADGVVDLVDLRLVASNWGSVGATPAEGDYDGDGQVGQGDWLAVREYLAYALEPVESSAISESPSASGSSAVENGALRQMASQYYREFGAEISAGVSASGGLGRESIRSLSSGRPDVFRDRFPDEPLVPSESGTCPTDPPLGDANGNGIVDLIDLDILGANFGTTSGATLAQGDFNGDGAVDLLDLDILGSYFGTIVNFCPTGTVSISGTAASGQLLSATVTGVNDDNGIPNDGPGGTAGFAYSYTWTVDGNTVGNGPTYTPSPNDVGGSVAVTVAFDDALDQPNTLASNTEIVLAPPSVSVATSYGVNEGQAVLLSGIAVTDIDAGSDDLLVTVQTDIGTLSATSGMGYATVVEVFDNEVTIRGTFSELAAFFDFGDSDYSSLSFHAPPSEPDANANLTIEVNDLSTGGGTGLIDTASSAVIITATNDQHSLSVDLPSAVSPSLNRADEQESIALSDFAVSLNDESGEIASSGVYAYSVSASLDDPSHGQLAVSGQAGSTVSLDGLSHAAAEDWIDQLVFEPADGFSGQAIVSIEVIDNDNEATVVLPPIRVFRSEFVVNSLRDFPDADTGLGTTDYVADTGRSDHPYGREVTLRAAVEQAAALSSLYASEDPAITPRITFADHLQTGQTIELDTATLGDLEIGDLIIEGADPSLMAIDANGGDRVATIMAGATVHISGVTITGGFAANGGGLLNLGDLTLSDVHVVDNIADNTIPDNGFGGGVYSVAGSSLTLQRSYVARNLARNGGGVRATLDSNDELQVIDSTIANNRVTGSFGMFGGGIIVGKSGEAEGTARIVNSTFSGNVAKGSGAGAFYAALDVINVADVTLLNNTFAYNVGDRNPAVAVRYNAGMSEPVVRVENNLFADNERLDDTSETAQADFSVSRANDANLQMVDYTASSNYATSTIPPLLSPGFVDGVAAADLRLSPLGDHGGSVPGHALVGDGGIAANAGSVLPDLSSDYRGVARDATPSVGAFEYVATSISITGDFDGDGREDTVAFDNAEGVLYVDAAHDEIGARPWGETAHFRTPRVGDFNGDGRDDLAFREDSETGAWTFALSESTRFSLVSTSESPVWHDDEVLIGDFDGDGRDELIGRKDGIGPWTSEDEWRVLDLGEDTVPRIEIAGHSFRSDTVDQFRGNIFVGDANRDGYDDLIGSVAPGAGQDWFVLLSDPTNINGRFNNASGSTYNWKQWFDGHYYDDADGRRVDADGPLRFVTEQFAEVYNNVELELYHGIRKGPQATQETRSASPWDQAALLTQLLADAGSQSASSLSYRRFEPTLVTGTITTSVEIAAEWLSAKANPDGDYPTLPTLLRLLDPSYSGSQIRPGQSVSFRHAWVRLRLPDFTSSSNSLNNPSYTANQDNNEANDGVKNYVDIDPSWTVPARLLEDKSSVQRFIDSKSGTELFDEIDYVRALSAAQRATSEGSNPALSPLEYYIQDLTTWLQENEPGISIADATQEIDRLGALGDVARHADHLINAQDVVEWGAYDLGAFEPSSNSLLPLSQQLPEGLDIIGNSDAQNALLHRVRLSSESDAPASWDIELLLPSVAYSELTIVNDSLTAVGKDTPLLYVDGALHAEVVDNTSLLGASPNSSVAITASWLEPGQTVADSEASFTIDLTRANDSARRIAAVGFDVAQGVAKHVDSATTLALSSASVIDAGDTDRAGEADIDDSLRVLVAAGLLEARSTREQLSLYGDAVPYLSPNVMYASADDQLVELPDTGVFVPPLGVFPRNLQLNSYTQFETYADRRTGQENAELQQLAGWEAGDIPTRILSEYFGASAVSPAGLLSRAYGGQPLLQGVGIAVPTLEQTTRSSYVVELRIGLNAAGKIRIDIPAVHVADDNDASLHYTQWFSANETAGQPLEVLADNVLTSLEPASGMTAQEVADFVGLVYRVFSGDTDNLAEITGVTRGGLSGGGQTPPGFQIATGSQFGSPSILGEELGLLLAEAIDYEPSVGAVVDPVRVLLQSQALSVGGWVGGSYIAEYESGAVVHYTDAFDSDEQADIISFDNKTKRDQGATIAYSAASFAPSSLVPVVDSAVAGLGADSRGVAGVVTVAATDVAYDNTGVPLGFSRTYNTNTIRDVGLGVGWTHSFSDRLVRATISGNAGSESVTDDLIWHTSGGVEYRFEWDAGAAEGGAYIAPTQLLGSMQGTPDGLEWVYTDREGNEVVFERPPSLDTVDSVGDKSRAPLGRLKFKRDANRNGVGVAYEAAGENGVTGVDRIDYVYDVHTPFADGQHSPKSRRLEFGYISATSDQISRIDKVVDGVIAAGPWTYGYLDSFDDDRHRLTEVVHPQTQDVETGEDDPAVEYNYTYYGQGSTDSEAIDGLLKTATMPNGDATSHEYYLNGRVFRTSTQTESGEDISSTYTYDLVNGKTRSQDANGNETTYFYNEDGLITRVINPDRTRTETDWGVRLSPSDDDWLDTADGGDGFHDMLDEDNDGILDGTEYLQTKTTDEVGAIETFSYWRASETDSSTTASDPGALDYDPGAYDRELKESKSKHFPQAASDPSLQDGLVTVYDYVAKNNGGATTDRVRVKEIVVDPTTVDPDTMVSTGENRVTQFVYDDNGRLLETIDPLSNRTTYTYHDTGVDEGLLESMTAPRGAGGIQSALYWEELTSTSLTIGEGDAITVTLRAEEGARVRADAMRIERILPSGVVEPIIIDNTDRDTAITAGTGAPFRLVGGGFNAGSGPSYDGDLLGIAYSETVTIEAIWTFADLPAGSYRVSATWDQHPDHGTGRYLIEYGASGSFEVSIDQRDYADDHNEYTTTYTYTGAGLVESVTVAGITSSKASYHHTGQIETSTDGSGRVVRNVYDDLGRLRQTILEGHSGTADGLATSYDYDQSGQLTSVTDALDRVTKTTYDDRGLVTEVEHADGSKIQYEYDGVGNRTAMTDELGRVTEYRYDSRNRLVATIHPDGAVAQVRYDGAGRVAESIDALGRRTQFKYDAAGRVLETVVAAGTDDAVTTQNKYNVLGELIETADARTVAHANGVAHAVSGSVVQFFYDDLGRVVKRMTLGRLDADNYSASALGRTPTNKRPSRVETMTYDANGNVSETIVYDTREADGRLTTLALLDPQLGELVAAPPTASLILGQATTFELALQRTGQQFDSFDRPTVTTYADGTNTTVSYDGAGRIRFTESERGARAENQYDEYGRLSTTILPDPNTGNANGLGPTTTRAYDAVGNVVSSTDANGNTTTFAYDSRNRQTSSTDAVGDTSSTLFDRAGQVVALVDAYRVAVASRYDKRGRVISRNWVAFDPDGPSGTKSAITPVESYQYDSVGNVIASTDRRGFESYFVYDSLNRLREERVPRTGTAGRLGLQVDDGDPNTDEDNVYAVGADLYGQDAQTYYSYDLNGNLTETIDANGGVTTFAYDELNRLVRETLADPDDVLGQDGPLDRLQFFHRFDGYGNVYQIDELVEGQMTHRTDTFRYDLRNRLVEEVLNVGTTEAAADKVRTLYEYDASGNLVALKEGVRENGEVFSAGIDTVTTRYDYDFIDRLIEEHLDAPFDEPDPVAPGRHSIYYAYDAFGNVEEETYTVRQLGTANQSSTVTAYRYDGLNRPTTVIEDFGGSVEATSFTGYDAVGNVVLEVDPTGIAVSHVYDELYRLVSTTLTDPTPFDGTASQLIETYEYDAEGAVVAYTNGEGDRTEYLINSYGQVIRERIKNPTGPDIDTVYKHDGKGNRTQVVDPNLNHTTFTYDRLDRVVQETQGVDKNTGDKRLYRYNSEGDLMSVVDRDGRVTDYLYDNLDRVVRERWYADENAYQVAGGNTLSQPPGSSNPIQYLSWIYDKRGRVVQAFFSDSTLTQSQVYTDTYEYDRLDRITSHKNYHTNPSIATRNPQLEQRYTYDVVAGLSAGAFTSSLYTQTYEPTRPTLPGAGNVYANTVFETDALGRLSRLYESGSTTPDSVDIDPKEITLSYDPAGRMTGMTRRADSDGQSGYEFVFDTAYGYDPTGRLSGIEHRHSTVGNNPFATYGYAYDNASRITRVDATTQNGTLAIDRVENFTHDFAGRLSEWSLDRDDGNAGGVDLNAEVNRTFTLDNAGNRDEVKDDGVPVADQSIGSFNRLESDGTYTYEYDKEGNVRSRDGGLGDYTEYVWDHRNRLVQVISKASATDTVDQLVRYYYNNDDLVVRKQVETVEGGFIDIQSMEHYVWDGTQLAAVLNGRWGDQVGADDNVNSFGSYQRRIQNGGGTDTPLFEEVFSTPVFGSINVDPADELLWAASDHAGSVRDVLDATHALVEHREYDPFGVIEHVVDGDEQAVGTDRLALDAAFAGREWDDDAGLYYNRARWYDASQGRFVSEDPIGFAGGDANIYRYGGGDPVNFSDPSGLFFEAYGGFGFDFYNYNFGLSDFDLGFTFEPILTDSSIGFGSFGFDPRFNNSTYGLFGGARYGGIDLASSNGLPFEGYQLDLLNEYDESFYRSGVQTSFDTVLQTVFGFSLDESIARGLSGVAGSFASGYSFDEGYADPFSFLADAFSDITGVLGSQIAESSSNASGPNRHAISYLGGLAGHVLSTGGSTVSGFFNPRQASAGLVGSFEDLSADSSEYGLALALGELAGTNDLVSFTLGFDPLTGDLVDNRSDRLLSATGKLSGLALASAGGYSSVVSRFGGSSSAPARVTRSGNAGYGYAQEVLEGGSGRAFAGHGEFRTGSGDFIVPQGTSITAPRPGIKILDRTAGFLERGDFDGLFALARIDPRVADDIIGLQTYLPGERIPDYTLKAPTGLTIYRGSTTVENATRLSELVTPNAGNRVFSACTECRR